MSLNKVIADIVKKQTPCFFVSPHLDDAVLSAGALLSYLARKTCVNLVTVFTQPSDPPYTLSVKSYLRQCGYADASRLFSDRRREDEQLCLRLGIHPVHLGFTDALWRRRRHVGSFRRLVGRYFPEVLYRYPVYRWHILSGRINSEDIALKQAVALALRSVAKNTPDAVAFSCGGIGNHIDHIIAREACLEAFNNVILWSDFPYNTRSKKPADVFSSLGFSSLAITDAFATDKKSLVGLYQTQVSAMFPGGIIPSVREEYRLVRTASEIPSIPENASATLAPSSIR